MNKDDLLKALCTDKIGFPEKDGRISQFNISDLLCGEDLDNFKKSRELFYTKYIEENAEKLDIE